jgi:hypothetical protein
MNYTATSTGTFILISPHNPFQLEMVLDYFIIEIQSKKIYLKCDLNFLCPSKTMLGGSLVTTAWRVLRLRMEGSPPGTEGSCEHIE